MLTIRVAAKTESSTFRVVEVDVSSGTALCNCGGFDGTFCAHIDAVLVAGERGMVPLEDYEIANEAMEAVAGLISPPADWRGSWRRNLAWRGLTSESSRPRRPRSGRPVVCFTGTPPDGTRRAVLAAAAEASGWEAIDSPAADIVVLVAADPTGGTRKLIAARRNGTPIVTYDEWTAVMFDGVFPESAV